MKTIHWVITDLFLPEAVAKPVCSGLALPALEKILARSQQQTLAIPSLEDWLCQQFALPSQAIAPITLQADGIPPNKDYWLRADPVHLRLDRDQMILQNNVNPSLAEAGEICRYLTDYFKDSGLKFFAPHPTRWYLQLTEDPAIITQSVSQVEGRNARFYLPKGSNASTWNRLSNEIQMALFAHPINQAAAERGEVSINSLWFWGGGFATTPHTHFQQLSADNELAFAFAQSASIPIHAFSAQPKAENSLLITEALSVPVRRGDFYAWREKAQQIEHQFAVPLLHDLQQGKFDQLIVDVIQAECSSRFKLSRAHAWKIWQRILPLDNYKLTS
jgi:hypothetical protein